jgi:hypothetical protein
MIHPEQRHGAWVRDFHTVFKELTPKTRAEPLDDGDLFRLKIFL